MNPLDDLIDDLVAENDLSTSLRKAKVLAYRLGNEEFKQWVESELNGYRDEAELPEYRKVVTISQGDFINPRWKISGQLIPTTHVPAKYRPYFTDLHLSQGAKELESMLHDMKGSDGSLKIAIPPEISGLLHGKVIEYAQCMRAWRVLNSQSVIRVLETARNRLLTFALELGDRFPEIRANQASKNAIPNEDVRQLFNITIQEGGSLNLVGSTETTVQTEIMTAFNQQGQTVGTQYNAGGDMNFGNVTNVQEFVTELQKLKNEFGRIAAEESIDAEIVTDVDYELTKAIQVASKPEPDKSSILRHLETAKGYVDSVGTLVTVGSAIASAIAALSTLL